VSVRQSNKILLLIVASSWVFYLSDWRCTEPQTLNSLKSITVCSCLLSIHFGKRTIHATLSDREFWDRWLSKSHTLLTVVNEFLPLVSVFINLLAP